MAARNSEDRILADRNFANKIIDFPPLDQEEPSTGTTSHRQMRSRLTLMTLHSLAGELACLSLSREKSY
jgi:hypothetical protein